MNLVATVKNILGLRPSTPSVNNIATAETPAQKFLAGETKISIPIERPARAKKDTGPSYNEMLGIAEPKTENRVKSFQEQWDENEQKKARQREASADRAAARKQKKLDELQFGVSPRIPNEWMRLPPPPITQELRHAVIIDGNLDVSPVAKEILPAQETYNRLSEIIKKHGRTAAVKKEKNRLLEFRKAYENGNPPESEFKPINYDEAEEIAQRHRSAIKAAFRRQTDKVFWPVEAFVNGQLIPAFERQADKLEKREREQHAASGGKFGLSFRPSQLLIAMKQAPTRLAEEVKTPPMWHIPPRAFAAQFGIIIDEKK